MKQILMRGNRVKLPKSFLAVNLSESHTFHKKDDIPEGVETTFAEMTGENEVFGGWGEGEGKGNELHDTQESPVPKAVPAPLVPGEVSAEDLDIGGEGQGGNLVD